MVVLEEIKAKIKKKHFKCVCEIEVKEKAIHKKKGRTKAGEVVETAKSYHISCDITGKDEETINKQLEKDGSFVLITSILEETVMNDEEILREYKHQNSVEEAFRFLKSPVYLGQTLLNKQTRVEAMGYVFILVLMVASYLQYRVRKSLADNNEYVLDPGRKKNTRPSVKRIFEILETVIIIKTSDGRFFPQNTPERVLKMIEWTGFSPEIYLKI